MEDSYYVSIDVPTNILLSFILEVSQELRMFDKYDFSVN